MNLKRGSSHHEVETNSHGSFAVDALAFGRGASESSLVTPPVCLAEKGRASGE